MTDDLVRFLAVLSGLLSAAGIIGALVVHLAREGPPIPDCGVDWVSRCPGAR